MENLKPQVLMQWDAENLTVQSVPSEKGKGFVTCEPFGSLSCSQHELNNKETP